MRRSTSGGWKPGSQWSPLCSSLEHWDSKIVLSTSLCFMRDVSELRRTPHATTLPESSSELAGRRHARLTAVMSSQHGIALSTCGFISVRALHSLTRCSKLGRPWEPQSGHMETPFAPHPRTVRCPCNRNCAQDCRSAMESSESMSSTTQDFP